MPRPQLDDPQLTSLKSAARAAIVMPAVFAVADKVIQDPQTALFAAFGSFAMLVLVDFTGPLRSRFVAYVALAFVGAANIVVGTLCSQNAWLATAAMAVVGFAILFSGVVNGYFAGSGTSGNTHVRPAGDDRGADVGRSGTAGGMGTGRGGRNLGAHAALAWATARRPSR